MDETGNTKETARAGSRVSGLTVRRVLWINGWAMLVIFTLGLAYFQHQRHQINRLIVEAAEKHGLDPRLVSAVVWKESRYKQDAQGTVGEIGLMQVRPSTAMDWARITKVEAFEDVDLFDPRVNLDAGCWYLARGYKKWSATKSDPWPWVLSQYHAGPSRVNRWDEGMGDDSETFIADIPFATTKEYVVDILARWRE